MKITFDWLQDHLKTNLKEKHLLEQLTNVGLEVESVENLSADNQLFKVLKLKNIQMQIDLKFVM
jgi:phenylalanyl-tRNA synthetase beta chain